VQKLHAAIALGTAALEKASWLTLNTGQQITRDIALASMARDDPPASSTASSTAAAMRGKVGSEFET